MKSIFTVGLLLLGIVWTFGLAALTVFNYFVALFNDYRVLITINEYGEYIYETPMLLLALPVMLFSTGFCMRLVIRMAFITKPRMKNVSDYEVQPSTDRSRFRWVTQVADNPVLEETPQVKS